LSAGCEISSFSSSFSASAAGQDISGDSQATFWGWYTELKQPEQVGCLHTAQ